MIYSVVPNIQVPYIPNKRFISVVIPGCPFGCRYCSIGEIRDPNIRTYVDARSFVTRLDMFISNVDGVLLTGGEPLIHPNFDKILDILSYFDAQVFIDTSGFVPFESYLEMYDNINIVMDIKVSEISYEKLSFLCGQTVPDPVYIYANLYTLEQLSSERYYLVTVIHENIFPSLVELYKVRDIILSAGLDLDRWILVPFNPSDRTLDPDWNIPCTKCETWIRSLGGYYVS